MCFDCTKTALKKLKVAYNNTVGAKEMFTLLKQQKIFLAKQGIKFHISLSLLSVGGV